MSLCPIRRISRSKRSASFMTGLLVACAPADAQPALLLVRAQDFAFFAPDSVPAGLTVIQMLNKGPSTHHVQLFRVPDSLVPAAVIADLPPQEPLPSYLIPVGGPEGAADHSLPVRTILWLYPGSYLLLCRFAAGDRLHYSLGMARALTVIGSGPTTARALPPVRDTITLHDYNFGMRDSVPAGADTFLVVNRGPHEHHVAVARVLPGRSLEDVLREMTTDDAPPAAEVLGGTAGLGVGEANLLPIALTPGRYVLLCFVPDPVSGRAHVALGMIREFVVYAGP